MMTSVKEIPENAFDSLPMILKRSGKELADFVDTISNIRTGKSDILESPNNGAIFRRVT
jgi:hypothetical protein